MDITISKLQSTHPGPIQQDQLANHAGSVIAFPSREQSSDRRLLRSLVTRQANQKPEPKAKELLSKYTKCYWPITVGAPVAAIADGRIVRGTVLGTNARPWRPAVFHREDFAGCWIRLDSGEHVVAHGLRPIQADENILQKPKSVLTSGSSPMRRSLGSKAQGPVQADFSWKGK